MKRMLLGLMGAVGVAMLIMWSASVSAQSVSCSGTTCRYGPICPDAWGGCYWYTWSIGSAVNSYEEKAGIANIVKLCDPSTLTNCVYVTSQFQLIKNGYNNILVSCRVPGAKVCTDYLCGGSPDSSSWIFAQTAYDAKVTETLDSSGCTREDKDKGGLKCRKTVTHDGPDNLAAQFCPNGNWIAHMVPVDFVGTTSAQGPVSKKDPNIITSFAKAHCWLEGPGGSKPWDPDYTLSSDPALNELKCEHLQDGISVQ